MTPRPPPDRPALPAELAAALAAHGVEAGPTGQEVAALLAAGEARGLAASVEEVAGGAPRSLPGRARYRALLWWSTERRQAHTPDPVTAHGSVRGRGRTEAEALAKALLAWLDRVAR